MKNIKELMKNGKVFIFYTIYIFLVYMMFMHPFVTSDHIPTYSTKDSVNLISLKGLISSGRFTSYFINRFRWLLARINVTSFENAYITQIMGIFFYSASCTIVFSLITDCFKDKNDNKFIKFCILFSVINPCVVETFRYGALDWSVGILLTIIGVKMLVQKQYLSGFIWGFFATSFYQSNCLILLIVSVGLLCVRTNSDDIKNSLKQIFFSICISGMCAIMNIGLQKLLSIWLFPDNIPIKNALIKTTGFSQHLFNIFIQMKRILLEFYSMLPQNCLLYFGFLLFIPTMFYLIRYKKYSNSIMLIMMLFVVITVPFSFGIVTPILWYAQRTMLSLFWGISILVILIIHEIQNCTKLKKYIYCITSIFAIIVLFYTETCITDSFITQAIDKSEAISIQNEIIRYEEKTGVNVKTIVSRISPDVNWENNCTLLNYKYITYNQRIVVDSWAQGGYINYINNSNYEFRKMTDDEFSIYFNNYRDWNSYVPSEQLHFEGSTLYWIIY